ncbi:MAG: HlyC/CorC family transporter [Gemmatimonadetes bacterium]|nr:HlyC/CorC family transporter [Gemmatimonadota bacterium]
MNIWLAIVGGLTAAALGTTVAVAAAAVSRLELTRWISQRLRGAAVASATIAKPGSLMRVASAVAAVGILTAGLGLAALVRDLSGIMKVGLLLFGAVPLVAVVCYAVPRAVGQQWCEPIVRRAGPWMRRLAVVVRPLIPGSWEDRATDFADMLRAGSAEDFLEPEEVSIISGVLDFTQRPVRDVMTPRTDVVALEEGALLSDVGRLFDESGYSRLPVYQDSFDHIVGMVYAFDLLKVEPGGQLPIRPVAVTPGSKPCAELLVQLQRERRQLAVVLDEFGGTAGIATFEDLLEVLVGDIFEEGEGASLPPGSSADVVELDGSTLSSDVANRFGIRLAADVETIGGLLAREAGRIPNAGDRFILKGLEFDVLAASPTRVERIAVRRGPVRTERLTSGTPD